MLVSFGAVADAVPPATSSASRGDWRTRCAGARATAPRCAAPVPTPAGVHCPRARRLRRTNRGSSCTKCRGGASAVFAATARCVSAARLPCTMYKGSLARKPWSKLRKRRKVTALRRFGRGAKARWGANGRDGQCSHCHHGLNLIFRDITFSPQAHPRPLAPPSRRPYRRPLRSLALLLAPPRASRPLAPTRATSAQTAARRLYYAVCRPRIAPIRAPSRLRAPLTPDTPTHDTRSRLTDAQTLVRL